MKKQASLMGIDRIKETGELTDILIKYHMAYRKINLGEADPEDIFYLTSMIVTMQEIIKIITVSQTVKSEIDQGLDVMTDLVQRRKRTGKIEFSGEQPTLVARCLSLHDQMIEKVGCDHMLRAIDATGKRFSTFGLLRD